MAETSKRILCIDDSLDTCEMVAIMLGSAGYKVSHATSVAEGLSLAKRGGFDIILLDWVFEDGSGLELCRMIRAFDTDTPIIFYSGVAYQSKIKEAMSAGAQGFLVKPVPNENLLNTVSQFVSDDPDGVETLLDEASV
jgi:DNA-binding response OmpR family regulator